MQKVHDTIKLQEINIFDNSNLYHCMLVFTRFYVVLRHIPLASPFSFKLNPDKVQFKFSQHFDFPIQFKPFSFFLQKLKVFLIEPGIFYLLCFSN